MGWTVTIQMTLGTGQHVSDFDSSGRAPSNIETFSRYDALLTASSMSHPRYGRIARCLSRRRTPTSASSEQLRDALLARIPVHAPEWADHDVSDPGVTLLELFAFLAENPFYLEEDSSDRASETLAAVRERLEGMARVRRG